jgi:hypothetical protein
VELLDDGRPAVRSAAREALRGKLAQWSDHPSAASDRRAALLAAELASHDPPHDVYNRVFVKLTALKLIRWKGQSDMTDQVKVLSDCSTILERTMNASITEPDTPVTFFEGDPSNPPTPDTAMPPAVVDLPVQPVSIEPKRVQSVEDDAPELLPRGDEEPLPPSRLQPEAPRRIRTMEVAPTEAQQTSAVDQEALETLSTRALMRHLQGVASVATAAEIELRRRGFDDQSMIAARAIDDPDPQVRLRLVESISSMAGIDAASWLWELADDDDERVRRAALSVLSTSSNPETRRRVAQRQGRDRMRR